MPNILSQVVDKINEMNTARLAENASGKAEILASNLAKSNAKTAAINTKKAASLASINTSHTNLLGDISSATSAIDTMYTNIIDNPASLVGDIKAISDEIDADVAKYAGATSTHVAAIGSARSSIETELGTPSDFTTGWDHSDGGYTPIAYSAGGGEA